MLKRLAKGFAKPRKKNHKKSNEYALNVCVCVSVRACFSFDLWPIFIGQLAWEFMLTNLIQRKSVGNDIESKKKQEQKFAYSVLLN